MALRSEISMQDGACLPAQFVGGLIQ